MITKTQLSQFLMEKGYNSIQIAKLTDELLNMSPSLLPLLQKWVLSDETSDATSSGYSLYGLMEEFGLKYPAALLTLDWIISEPEKAIPIIKKGIR